jgi:Cof subfamily protein (haloacid dehalogenase superfamily)
MSNIKLIALDLDGTLLRSDKTISPRNHAAVRCAIEAGMHVILASGRMHSATVKYAVDLDFAPDTFVVSYNGAMARSVVGETLFDLPLAAESASYVVGFCQEHGHHLNYYLNDTLYTAANDRWVDVYLSRTGSETTIVGDLNRFAGERPTKLIIIDDKPVIDRLLPTLQAHFGDSANVMQTDDEYLEFMAAGANKGLAVQRVAANLGVSQDQCLAMGDNFNDLTMLVWAGRGVAMSNGRRALLDRIVEHAPAADDDGVATVIESLIA